MPTSDSLCSSETCRGELVANTTITLVKLNTTIILPTSGSLRSSETMSPFCSTQYYRSLDLHSIVFDQWLPPLERNDVSVLQHGRRRGGHPVDQGAVGPEVDGRVGVVSVDEGLRE